MTEEQRRFTRVPFKAEAELKVDGKSYRVDKISNLGVGGCLMAIDDSLQAGTKCHVAIHLGGPTTNLTVRVDGEIVRTSPGAVAVKFTGVELDSLHHLQNIVRYNSSDPDAVEKELRDNVGIT